MRLWLALALAAIVAGAAQAQTGPTWVPFYTPSPTEWNQWFSSKVDVANGTLTGPIITGPVTLGQVQIVSGVGSPNGMVTAPVGSMYHRVDGAPSSFVYVKETSGGNTGWVGLADAGTGGSLVIGTTTGTAADGGALAAEIAARVAAQATISATASSALSTATSAQTAVSSAQSAASAAQTAASNAQTGIAAEATRAEGAETTISGAASSAQSTASAAAASATQETTRAEAAEATKAPSANPTFTGVVTVPTATAGDNTTKAASTAFVSAAISGLAPGAGIVIGTTAGTARDAAAAIAAENAAQTAATAASGVAASAQTAATAASSAATSAQTAATAETGRAQGVEATLQPRASALVVGTAAGTARDAAAAITAETAASTAASTAQTTATTAQTAAANEATRAEGVEATLLPRSSAVLIGTVAGTARDAAAAIAAETAASNSAAAAQSAVTAEATRAEGVEASLQPRSSALQIGTAAGTARDASLAITAENAASNAASTAQTTASAAQTATAAETSRAEAVEATLQPKSSAVVVGTTAGTARDAAAAIAAETSAASTAGSAQSAATSAQSAVTAETTRAEGVEATLQSRSSAIAIGTAAGTARDAAAAITAETAAQTAASSAQTTATNASTATAAETTRAEAAEGTLRSNAIAIGTAAGTARDAAAAITAETAAQTAANNAATATASETTRAEGVEATLQPRASALVVGTAAGTARDAAAAIAAETAASNAAAAAQSTASAAATATSVATAVSAETSRAETAEGGLLPKSGTTVAGLSVSSSPTAAQLAAALPTASTSGPGLVPTLTGSTVTYLRSDGTQATPPSGGTTFSAGTALTLSGGVLSVQVGTANGTVAGGNDSRITGALQTSAAGPLATAAGSSAANAITTALGFTPAPTASPQFSGTPTSVTPTAGDNSNKISTTAFDTALVGIETSRAETAEGGLLPKSGTTVAGLAVSTSPTAAQLAAALPTASTSGPGLVPTLTGSTVTYLRSDGTQATPPTPVVVTTSSPGLVPTLPGISTTALTGAGIFSPVAIADSAASLSAQTAGPTGAVVFRTFKQLLGEAFQPRSYGATGNNTAVTVASTYPSITSLSTLVSYTNANGEAPFTHLDNPLFGLTSTMTTTAAAAANATSLNFAETNHSNPGDGGAWTTSYLAPWQDPNQANPIRAQPGDVITGSCGANTVAGIDYVSARQGEELPGATDWIAGATYGSETVTASFFGTAMYLSAAPTISPVSPHTMTVTSAAGAPYHMGVVSGSGTSYVLGAAIPNSGASGAGLYTNTSNTVLNIFQAPTSGAFAVGQVIYLPGYGVTPPIASLTGNTAGSTITLSAALTISSGTFNPVSSTTPESVTLAHEVYANGGFYQATNTTAGASATATKNVVSGAQATFSWNGTSEIMTLTTAATTGSFVAGDLVYGPALPTGTAITSGSGNTIGTQFVLNTPADQQFTAAAATMVNANVAGPAGAGSSIVDGGVIWKYLKPVASQNVPSGIVYLTTALGASCASGSSVTMTIAPAALTARTMDWLGVQTALKDAYYNPTDAGGKVDLGAGQYVFNGPLYNAGGSSSTGGTSFVPNVSLIGHGTSVTQLVWNTDLGQDQCGVAESNRSYGFVSGNVYSDFSIIGPGAYTTVQGVSPNHMDGVCVGTDANLYRLRINNTNGGVNLIGNHQILRDVFSGGGCSLLMAQYTPNVGNQNIDGGALAGTIAGICVTSTNQLDSGQVVDLELGYGYSGVYHVPSTPNISYTPAILAHAMLFSGVSDESLGAPFFLGTDSLASVNNNVFIGLSAEVGISTSVELTDGNGGFIPNAAFFQVANLESNTFLSSNLYNVSQFSVAVLNIANTCSSNHFYDDLGMIQGISGVGAPTAASPTLKCGNGTGNVDTTTNATYEFWQVASSAAGLDYSSAFTAAGVPVTPFIGSGVQMEPINSDTGQAVYGVTAAPCPEASYCPVQTSGTTSILAIGTIAAAQPVVATHLGIAQFIPGGIVQDYDATAGAIGMSIAACSGSTSAPVQCSVLLGNRGGASSVNSAVSAAGSSCSAAQQLSARLNIVTTATASTAAYVGLPQIGAAGAAVTVINATSATIYVCPPSGGTLQALSANTGAPIAAGGQMVLHRTGTAAYY